MTNIEKVLQVRYADNYKGKYIFDDLKQFDADNGYLNAIDYAIEFFKECDGGAVEIWLMEREYNNVVYENGVYYSAGWGEWEPVSLEYKVIGY